MIRAIPRWIPVLLVVLAAGCGGSAGNIESGIPANPAEPVNPTPDMVPPPTAAGKAPTTAP